MTLAAIVVVAIVIVAVGAYAFFTYGSGTLELIMNDPPLDWGLATQVYVNYSSIEVHRADAGNVSGWSTAASTGGVINLTEILDLNQTIGSMSLQAGKYNLLRFAVLDATVTVADVNYTATVSNGNVQIAITEGGINVSAGQTSKLLIRLDVIVEGSVGSFKVTPDVRATPV